MYWTRRIIIGLVLLYVASLLNAQLSVVNVKDSISVKTGTATRLNNGTGFVDSTRKGNIRYSIKNDVALLELVLPGTIGTNQFAGIFFDNIPKLAHGITFWRYKPWNSWTKPVAITDATQMESWDVQFFYWQYEDGVYGAAVPLSGNGFRATLGSDNGRWGSKAVSYAPDKNKVIPALALAFGKDPYELFARIYRNALHYMSKDANIQSKKTFPEPFNYIGWCTWNSSNMGKDLDEKHLLEGIKTFSDHHFPLGWLLIDDGWFRQQDSRLQSMLPDPVKFPNGFKSLLDRLKKDHSIKYAGIWHAFNGYWNGIDPGSELGIHFGKELFSWTQPERVDVSNSVKKTYYFIKPGDSLNAFYDQWHRYLKGQGFDFIKVDNQLVAERMAVDNYPLFDLSDKMHKALYASANKYFKNAVINCMDMTADAYLNFGSSAVARAEEDYFPYEAGETYNLQRGNAAAHVLQAIYNSVYFSQMVYPDFDMFESYNPNAIIHALARTLNNGPIYITDKPGQQNFELLDKIVFHDGCCIRSATSLLPTEDCLFQVQEPKLFKAFSKVENTGLIVAFNLADTSEVGGELRPTDVSGIRGDRFLVYDYFHKSSIVLKPNDHWNSQLPQLGYGLFYIIPIGKQFAPIGLINKYNAPATIISEKWINNQVIVTLYEGGQFSAYAGNKPKAILVNNKSVDFSYERQLIEVKIDADASRPVVQIAW